MAEAPLSRRRLLAVGATATLGALAGCTDEEVARLNPFWDAPITMKVIAASGDETETTCTLDADEVDDIPELKRPLQRLSGAEDGRRIVKRLTTGTGQEISNMLTRKCGDSIGGLYQYEGEWFLMGLTFEAQEDHQQHHEEQGGHGGTETATPTETAN
ncbi:MAG: hypothetical protein V5A38_05800 [Halolamina sp.]|uniref:hypothetical protein n=1 Tax=Halolamina sp. TaxID=1940283 RepID=UPI002FC37FD9